MQSSPLKSRPVYGTLKPVPLATFHIVLAEGDGAHAVIDAFAGQDALRRTAILFLPSARTGGLHHANDLEALSPHSVHVAPSPEELLDRLATVLSAARMGTRLYLSGTEDFIGRVRSEALHLGVDADAIQSEHRGPPTRRVQCVHCKGFTAGVMASPAPCTHCGIQMLVRDHYSRRLGAFMGVSVDAEAPGDVPPAEAFRV